VLMALGQDAEKAGLRAARRLRRLGPASSLEDVATWVEHYLGFWDAHGPFVYAVFQAAYADRGLLEWGLRAEMTGARALGNALVHLRGGRRYPAGVDPLIEGLALQSMIERFWYHWRVAGAPIRDENITRSIAHLIWSSAHAE